jgi:DNA-binding NarL/FixJ family response regulator
MAERNRRILELVSQGVSVRQIAQQLRKTTTRVRQIIREAREANETQPTTGER